MAARTSPFNSVSSFIGVRTDNERAVYEDVRDFNKNWFDRASNPEFLQYEQNILSFARQIHNDYFKWGFLTVDSSEAIYCALLIHLLKFKERTPGTTPNLVISKLGHICYKKAAVLLGFEIREAAVTDKGEVDLADLKRQIDADTFVVVAVAGTTTLGSYDNVIEMDKLCAKAGIPLHIDAATGGFIYPFKPNAKIPADFQTCQAVASLNISGHKYGYARPSVAILLLRDKGLLPKEFYSFSIPYLSDNEIEEPSLTGSKSPIGLIDLNFNVTTWGINGYRDIVTKTFEQKEKLMAIMRELDELEVIDSGDTPIFVIGGDDKTLSGLSAYLRERGWANSYSSLPDNRVGIRVVVRKHFEDDYINDFADAVKGMVTSRGIEPRLPG